MMFNAMIKKESGMYIAECIEIGTVSQGKTINDALLNLSEATSLYLEEFPEKIQNKSVLRKFEVQIAKT
jgi:predicted RNase H-like HicB family nuclease